MDVWGRGTCEGRQRCEDRGLCEAQRCTRQNPGCGNGSGKNELRQHINHKRGWRVCQRERQRESHREEEGGSTYGLKRLISTKGASPVAQTVKNPPEMQETRARSLGREDALEEGMATHSSVLAWRIPWTEEPGGLQSLGSQRVGYN